MSQVVSLACTEVACFQSEQFEQERAGEEKREKERERERKRERKEEILFEMFDFKSKSPRHGSGYVPETQFAKKKKKSQLRAEDDLMCATTRRSSNSEAACPCGVPLQLYVF